MSTQLKLVLLGLAAVVGGLVGVLVLKALVFLLAFALGASVAAFAAGVILFGFVKTKQKAGEVVTAAKATVAAAARRYDPLSEQRKALSALTALNTDLRLAHGVSSAVLGKTEGLIDRLAPLVETLYGTYPSDTTTWNTAAIATDHLPALVRRYLAIAADGRAQAETEVSSALDALRAEVDNLASLIERHNLDDARAKAETIKSRFGATP